MTTDIEEELEHVEKAKLGFPVLRVKLPSGREVILTKIGHYVRVQASVGPDRFGEHSHNAVLLDLTLEKADWLPALLDLNNWIATQERT